jgi:hypothetical protein
MNALARLDQLAQSLESESESMGLRLTIEVGSDGAVVQLEIIVSIPGEGPEAGYGVEVGARSSESALQLLLVELDAGGLAEARAFAAEHRRKATL